MSAIFVVAQSEMDNYSLLLKTAAISLRKLNKLTTVALHPGQKLADLPSSSNNNKKKNSKKSESTGGENSVVDFIDRIHLMAYDMNGKGGHHSSLIDSQNSVKFLFSQSHVPPEKIILGIPAYSRNKVLAFEFLLSDFF
jgi:spore germination protein YaaH